MNELDSIDGLIKYVEDIKPYHSKVIEVLTEYVYNEAVNVTISENFVTNIGIVVLPVNIGNQLLTSYGGTFGVGPYDSFEAWPVISINSALPDGAFDATNPGYILAQNTVIIPDDQTPAYRIGRNAIVTLFKVDTVTDAVTVLSTTTYTITGSTFVNTGQIAGIQNNPHTRVALSGLDDPASYALGPNERFNATIELTPVPLDSVALGYGSATQIFYTDVPPPGAPTPAPNPIHVADEDILNNVYANSILLTGDVIGSYPYDSRIAIELVSGDVEQYTVVGEFYDSVNDKTIIRLLETLSSTAPDYVGAEVIELFLGLDTASVLAGNALETVEGLLQTNISESLVVSWGESGNPDVIDGKQYLIKEVTGTDTFTVNGDVSDRIAATDTINVIESLNNGMYTVTGVVVNGQTSEITVSSTLTNTTGGGWVETT